MIDFTLSPEQNAIRSKISTISSDFLATAYNTYEKPTTQIERFRALQPFYRKAVQANIIKSLIPLSYGGTGGTLTDAAILVESMVKIDRSLSMTIFSTGLGLSPLLLAGSEAQKKEYLEPFLSGEGEPLASLLHSEPAGTANWLEKGGVGVSTTARRDGEEWIIDGEKIWASNASGWDDHGADLLSVVCRASQTGEPQALDTEPSEHMMILLITRQNISQNAPSAFTITKHPETTGLTSTSGPQIRFTSFRVPAGNLLAQPGTAAPIITRAFTSSAALVGAMSTGIMSAVFEATLSFVKSDKRGGAVSLLERQSVADKLMDVKMRCDAARSMTWKACHALENGKGGELAFETKIWCSEMAVKCCVDAMMVVGISSYEKDTIFSRLLNDAMCLPLTGGGNIGVRRRQLEKLFMAPDYDPWASTF